ncbi:hypothetical protein SDC9_204554 [bioreactor metagenome]|uniref:Uncharacterized protein n=1 Tax=bioreactor metagenome TaxID=1076179 RepID=A0A645IZW3_9ZZZZ
MGQGAEVAEHPLLRMLPDGAGVENHHVGLLRLVGEGKAHFFQHPHQLFPVGHVLLAAEGVHAGGRAAFPR